MERDKKFRALAIAAICVAIVGVSVAYAALQASLTITGTATVSTADAWKIEWIQTYDMVKSTAVTAEKAQVVSGNQNITWDATFGAPKTHLEFVAKFQNLGTIPAKLEAGTYVTSENVGEGTALTNFTYTVDVCTDNAQACTTTASIDGYAGRILNAGKEVYVKVRVEFDAAGALKGDELAGLNDQQVKFYLNLPWSQATDSEVTSGTSF